MSGLCVVRRDMMSVLEGLLLPVFCVFCVIKVSSCESCSVVGCLGEVGRVLGWQLVLMFEDVVCVFKGPVELVMGCVVCTIAVQRKFVVLLGVLLVSVVEVSIQPKL